MELMEGADEMHHAERDLHDSSKAVDTIVAPLLVAVDVGDQLEVGRQHVPHDLTRGQAVGWGQRRVTKR